MKVGTVWRVMSFLVLTCCITIYKAFPQQTVEDEKARVVLYIPGRLGDKSHSSYFFDSAHRGVEKAAKELDVIAKTIEGGYREANWKSDITKLAEGDWDIIIAGPWQLTGYLQDIALAHPNKVFVTYEALVDYARGNLDNVYSILYAQNEGSFLVGALAAMITTSDMPNANPEKVIGFLGGRNIPIINDFKVGYIQGAKYIDPEIKVIVSYADTFTDPAIGKKMGLDQYERGVDIAFNASGATGIGLLDAAKDKDRYAIGVDSDQYLLLKDTEPEMAENIVTSMMKNIDVSLYRAIKMYLDGTLLAGKVEVLGLAEGGVGVADNENYRKLIPREFRDRILDLEDRILSGLIIVETTMGQ
jgi:basic membrane protein A